MLMVMDWEIINPEQMPTILFDGDNDGYLDNVDILPNIASPGDLDNDGVPDELDAFPEDYRESSDADGDGR